MPFRDLAFRIVVLKSVAVILVVAIAAYVFANIRGMKRRREPRGFEVNLTSKMPVGSEKERDNDHG